MDRFIGKKKLLWINDKNNLKSNMDRFIGGSQLALIRYPHGFKIQYG